jgi:hypothetical protein
MLNDMMFPPAMYVPAMCVAVAIIPLLFVARCWGSFYSKFWWTLTPLSAIGCLTAIAVVRLTPAITGRPSNPGGPSGNLLVALVGLAAFAFVLYPSFPVALGLVLLPPKHMRRPIRVGVSIVGVIVVATLAFVDWRLENDWALDAHRVRKQNELAAAESRAKREQQRKEINAKTPPNPELGPRSIEEWRYLGVQAQYIGNRPSLIRFGITSKTGATEALWNTHSVERLILVGDWVTDDELKNLTHITDLDNLELTDTSVTDEGVRVLSKIQGLNALTIRNAKVTNASLETFLEFPRLEVAWTVDTGITHEELLRFEEVHPDRCRSVGDNYIVLSRRSRLPDPSKKDH